MYGFKSQKIHHAVVTINNGELSDMEVPKLFMSPFPKSRN
jgi:hypothetical protein